MKSKNSKIENVLVNLKILPNVKGYDYVRYILEMYEQGSMIENMSDIYMVVSKKFNVSTSSVERAIRNLTTSKEMTQRLNKMMGISEDNEIIRFTSTQMLSCIKMILDR